MLKYLKKQSSIFHRHKFLDCILCGDKLHMKNHCYVFEEICDVCFYKIPAHIPVDQIERFARAIVSKRKDGV